MNRRRQNKRLARDARRERTELVHAAGCVEPVCASKWFLYAPEWAKDPETARRRVSVPRSIRRYLGRYTGATP